MIKIAIIGGGASGLLSAILTARAGFDVTIFESATHFAKKLSMTGNGKCNITNNHLSDIKSIYYAKDYDFLSSILKSLDFYTTKKLFKSIGVEIIQKHDTCFYPKNNSAKLFATYLINLAQSLNIKLKTNCPIIDIKSNNMGYKLKSHNFEFYADRIIIATGSRAGLNDKSDVDTYKMIQNLGHTINTILPALTALKIDDKIVNALAKQRMDMNVNLIANGIKIATSTGEIQFNLGFISGIPILNISHVAVEKLFQNEDVYLLLDAYFDITIDSLYNILKYEIKNLPNMTAFMWLNAKFPEKYSRAILNMSNIKIDTKISSISDETLKLLCRNIKEWKIKIIGYNDLSQSQVSQGGVALNEIDPHTMMSKIKKNIYFCGEILDVDGICGGYNLQWAWSTAYVAAKNACK